MQALSLRVGMIAPQTIMDEVVWCNADAIDHVSTFHGGNLYVIRDNKIMTMLCCGDAGWSWGNQNIDALLFI